MDEDVDDNKFMDRVWDTFVAKEDERKSENGVVRK